MTETVAGITYQKPTVVLLQETGIGTSEYAARTCYDSFESSENECIKQQVRQIETKFYLCPCGKEEFTEEEFKTLPSNKHFHPLCSTYGHYNGLEEYTIEYRVESINTIEHSDLLDDLAWTYFHHSILEHANLTFLCKGVPRGVLQEHARHRIQAISVQSTRYTMSSIINAFVAERLNNANTYPSQWFIDTVLQLDLFVTTDTEYNIIQIVDIFNRLSMQYRYLGTIKFLETAIAKSSLPTVEDRMSSDARYLMLQAGKKKRNVGDAFKHIVTDNWKCDMVVTMNLRALKNYLSLRDSGAAYVQMRWLAQAIKEATPQKYLDLIIKAK